MSRSRPRIPVDWFISEWMDHLRVNQTYMVEHAGWSKTVASHIYNHQKNFTPALLKSAALALNLRPYELLMHPEEAMALRRLHENAVTLAAERRLPFTPADPESEGNGDAPPRLTPTRKAG